MLDHDQTEDASTASSGFTGGDQTAAGEDLGRFKGMGPLLEEPNHEKVVKGVQQFVLDTKRARARRRAEWERNKLWVKGVRGVELRRISEDRDDVELHVDLGAFNVPPIMDRTDELLEKRVAHLTSDPAVPEAEPASEADEDRDAAEFTTRLLTVLGAESGYNNQGVIRRSLRKAGIFASAFAYPCVDPKGGGWRPMEVRATKQATTLADAEVVIDPTTGEPRTATDEELETRYVRTDENGIKVITDDRNLADRQWLPSHKVEILTGEHVILVPETCTGINDADAVVIMRQTQWGKLVSSFPELAKLTEDEKREIINWKPEDAQKTTPAHAKDSVITGTAEGDEAKVPDHAPVTPLVLYHRSNGTYPKGAYIICAGPKRVLFRDMHVGMVEAAKGEELVEERLMIPLAQFRDLDDDVDDDPYGKATAAKLGPADEIRGDIVLAWLDYLERFTRPHTFLPIGSIVQPGQLNNRDADAILFNPQGKPEYEQIPNFPGDAKEFFDRAGDSQDSRSLLEATAQGVDSANSVSGVAKDRVIQQAHVNLTTARANAADGQERLWRIITQQVRVYWTINDKIKVTGDDGAFKVEEWNRTNLGSTVDIKIARGSFTQLSPEQKQDALDLRRANGLVSDEEYQRLSSSNLKATLGVQDNPHRLRVKRQITAFRKGPPMGKEQFAAMVAKFEAAMQAYQRLQAAQQAMAAMAPPPPLQVPGEVPPSAGVDAAVPGPAIPQAAAPAPMPVAPLPPAPEDPIAALDPFAGRLPIDEEKDVAVIRWAEERAEIAGTSFQKHHPRWRQFLLDSYALDKKAAGIMTVAEEQGAMAQQAQAAQDAELKKEQLKVDAQRQMHAENLQAKAAEAAQKAQLTEAERARKAEEAVADRAAKLNDTAMRATGADLSGPPMAGAARNTTL